MLNALRKEENFADEAEDEIEDDMEDHEGERRAVIYDFQKHKALQEAREREKLEKEKRESFLKKMEKVTLAKDEQAARDLSKKAIGKGGIVGFISALSQIRPLSDGMYFAAFLAAILKDFLDFLQVTGVLYLLVIVLTLLASIFIAFMIFLGSSSNGINLKGRKTIRKWLILLAGTTTEIIMGLNFLPIETLTVGAIYFLILLERKSAASSSPE